jgi:hypothetical protein
VGAGVASGQYWNPPAQFLGKSNESISCRSSDGKEALAIKTNFELAVGLIGDRKGIITEMIIDEEYPEGVGTCNHWHFGEEDES